MEDKRADEYLPYPDESLDPPLSHPHGRLYPRFLIDEVMPAIDRRFRTRTGAAHTGLGGASYGAYIALYTATQRPGIFGKLFLQSTPVFIQDYRILADARSAERLPDRVSIEVGSQETSDPEINKMVGEHVRRLKEAVLQSSPQAVIRVVVEEGGEHNSLSWKRRLPGALEFLLGRD